MPVHDWRCQICGHTFEQMVAQGVKHLTCPKCSQCTPECAASHIPGYDVMHVGGRCDIVFLKAPAGFVQRDIHYDSPIDGRVINSKQARIEDLKRNGCVEYDPEMRKDADRNRKEADERLERAIDETVEAAVAVMDVRKQEKLAEELRGGASVEVTRPTGATLH